MLLAVLCALTSGPVQASSTPPSAIPERVSPSLPQAFETELPTTPPPEGSGPLPINERPDNAAEIPLSVSGFEFDGAQAIDRKALAEQATQAVPEFKTLADVYAAADALTAYYRDQGFLMARVGVPAQEIRAGVVRLQVDEGRIGSVEAQGDFTQRPLVETVLDRVRAHKVLNIRAIEHELLTLNDLPGSSFRVVLVPAPDGTTGVVIIGAEDRRWSGSVQFDNSGSSYLGPYLVSGSVGISNLLAPLQQTTLSLSSTSQIRELNSATLTHAMPIAYAELMLTLEASATQGEPGDTLKTSAIESRSAQLDARLDWSILRQRTDSLIVSTGVTLRNSTTDALGTRFSRDGVRALYLGARYDWQDFLAGYNLSQLQLSRGLSDFLDGSQTGDANLSREQARGDFTKLELSLLRNQSFTEDISLFGALRGQLSDSALFASEEFGFGGAFMGRAYDTSEKTGDSGVSVLVEARYRSLETTGLLLQPFAFYDYGIVWNRDTDQQGRDDGSSAGLGLRVIHDRGEAKLILAQPLINSDASTYPNNSGPRMLFSLRSEF
jgi:hemolysin activation/secretion protein